MTYAYAAYGGDLYTPTAHHVTFGGWMHRVCLMVLSIHRIPCCFSFRGSSLTQSWKRDGPSLIKR